MIGMFRAASDLLARARLGSAVGRTFGGDRDIAEALGYKTVLTPDDYWLRYERNSVAARIVEAFAEGTWRGEDVELIEIEDPERYTPFESEWKALNKRLKIWPTFQRADTLSGLGRFGVVVYGCPGDLSSPVKSRVKPEDLLFLSVYSEKSVKIKNFEDRLSVERFGAPLIYQLSTLNPSKNTTKQVEIHWSRILHIAEKTLDQPYYGQPRLKRVWNLLDDLEKVTGGGSEAFWLRAHQGYQFDLDPETELDETGEKEMSEEITEYMHKLRRYVRTRGVKMNSLGSDVADFAENAAAIVSQLSSGTGIPQRILMGSEQGQLASEQDRVNWSERVQDRRTSFASPNVVEPFVNWLIEHRTISEPKDPWKVRWPRVFDLSEGERVKIANGIADVCQKYQKEVVPVNELRDKIFGYNAIEDKDMKPLGPKVDPFTKSATGSPTGSPNPSKPGEPSN